MHDYLLELNDVQQQAVKYIDGPQLIIAGAGSGKTRVLTFKIVHLINSGYNPANILALTFTNKAAREMKERMESLMDKTKIAGLRMGTFHSIFAKILRVEGFNLGYSSQFTIYDSDDTKRVLKEIIKEMNLDSQQYPINEIYSRISKAKNNLILPAAYENDSAIQQQDIAIRRPETSEIYKTYQQKLKNSNAMDFDDLLVNMNILFRDFPQILEKYQRIFQFILVDEYQDTNISQYIILKKLSDKHRKICAVGDDSQSIYAFRGAKIENILNFTTDFKEHKIFKLEKNYRSTKNIVNIANSLIEKNKNRIPKVIFTDNEQGDKVKVVQNINDKGEALFIAKKINEIKRTQNSNFSDFAVLYRTNAQSRNFEDVFRKLSIPYKIYGSISFYQRAEIKDVLAYLRLIINKNDDLALKRIINYPARGIGDKTVEKLATISAQNNINLWNVLSNKQILVRELTARTFNQINLFVEMINNFTNKSQEIEVNELLNLVVEKSGIKQQLSEDKSPEGISKFENVEELINAVQDYIDEKNNETEQENIDNRSSFEKFLEEIALATDQDTQEDTKNSVVLMTIHASKGLEFKTVFIAGMEEGLFPSFRSIMSPTEIEEERRLFYVAITRSQKNLFITYANERYVWGKTQMASPSRFINELNAEFLELEANKKPEEGKIFEDSEKNSNFANKTVDTPVFTKPKKLKKIETQQTTVTEIQQRQTDEDSGLSVGFIVEHKSFGKGKIIKIEGNAPNTQVEIDFESVGIKKLLLKFAKLTIIEK